MTGLTSSTLLAAILAMQAVATPPATSVDSLRSEMRQLASQIASQRREIADLAQEGHRWELETASGLNAVSVEVIASRKQALIQAEQARSAADSLTTGIHEMERRARALVAVELTTLFLLVLGVTGLILIRRRRQTDSKQQLITTSALREEFRTMLPELRSSIPNSVPAILPTAPDSLLNHALAIQVSDEIHRMRIRVSQLVENGTATKALKRSVDRIEESLNEAGYSIPDLVGKKYHDGMTLDVHFIPDETLVGDDRVIGRVIRPQVNFRDVLIQPAEVEVRTGIPRHISPALVS